MIFHALLITGMSFILSFYKKIYNQQYYMYNDNNNTMLPQLNIPYLPFLQFIDYGGLFNLVLLQILVDIQHDPLLLSLL